MTDQGTAPKAATAADPNCKPRGANPAGGVF